MGNYTMTVQATSNSSGGTADTFIDLDAPASTTFRVYRIRVSCNTAADDSRVLIQMWRKTAIGSGSVAGTEIKHAPTDNAPLTVATLKNGTNAYAAGTTTDKLLEDNMNCRGVFEWVARDESDMFESGSGDIIGVNLTCSAASKVFNVTMDWIE